MKFSFSLLFTLKGVINRRIYAILGTVIFFIKYNIDRILASQILNKPYVLDQYFFQGNVYNLFNLTEAEETFLFLSTLFSLPFIYVGTLLTIKRLKDINLNPFYLGFFFIPYLNILLFFILCLLPSNLTQINKNKFDKTLEKFIPQSLMGNVALGLSLSIIIGLIITLISIFAFESYGYSLFIGVPFMAGFLSTFFYHMNQPINIKVNFKLPLLRYFCYR